MIALDGAVERISRAFARVTDEIRSWFDGASARASRDRLRELTDEFRRETERAAFRAESRRLASEPPAPPSGPSDAEDEKSGVRRVAHARSGIGQRRNARARRWKRGARFGVFRRGGTS